MKFDVGVSGAVIVSAANGYQPFVGSVGVRDGRIALVTDKKLEKSECEQWVDGADRILMPGLVNAHCHGDMTLARGLGDDLTLLEQNQAFADTNWFYTLISDDDRFASRQLTYCEALLSAHREENIDTEQNFIDLFTSINALAEKYDMPILYSCHPRSKKRLEQSGFKLDKRVIQHEPLGFHDYNKLQMNAFCVVSDSGTLPEESSFFTSVGNPFPAVCIRTSTERPEALDKACFILAGIDEKSLLQAVTTAIDMNENGDCGTPVPNYTDENVSTKVVKLIQSYTGVVNKMVWRKL